MAGEGSCRQWGGGSGHPSRSGERPPQLDRRSIGPCPHSPTHQAGAAADPFTPSYGIPDLSRPVQTRRTTASGGFSPLRLRRRGILSDPRCSGSRRSPPRRSSDRRSLQRLARGLLFVAGSCVAFRTRGRRMPPGNTISNRALRTRTDRPTNRPSYKVAFKGRVQGSRSKVAFKGRG
jgi:hypothetical protein